MPPKKNKKFLRHNWVSIDSGLCVPSWRLDSAESSTTFIFNGVLHCTVTDHVVQGWDILSRILCSSFFIDPTYLVNVVYVHPETMKQCQMKISKPVLVISDTKVSLSLLNNE